MGLIKEPKNVDFFVIEKQWSIKELSEFSKLIHKKKKTSLSYTNLKTTKEMVN